MDRRGAPPPHEEDLSPDAVTASADGSSEAMPSQHEVGAQEDGPAVDVRGSAAALPSPEVISVDDAPEICPPAEMGPEPVSEGCREREQAPALHEADEPVDNLDRPSPVKILARLASSARLFRSADGRFWPRFRLAIDWRSTGSSRRHSATG